MAFFVIGLTPGLPPDRLASARDAAPGFMETPAPYPEMLETAGFGDVTEEDVTDQYRTTAASWLHHAAELEADLREVLGDQGYEEKLATRTASFGELAAGNTARWLYTARA